MSFVSLSFLVFLPIVFMTYWLLHRWHKWQNVCLLTASYVFYGWWDWRFLGLIILTSLSSFSSGLLLDRFSQSQVRTRLVLWCNILLNIGILSAFKYFDFFTDSLASLLAHAGISLDMPTLGLILPVGISFYTFQSLSYTIDVYRGQIRPTTDILSFCAFVAFFPQLVAGPIERASSLLPQIQASRHFSYDEATEGLRRILWGFFKKMVVADNCALAVNQIWSSQADCSSLTLLAGMVLFSFQIYGDFSGYSDIAVGTARLFGIRLTENFRLPYFSRSMAEFWRRWHISLMSWFRDYLYIPLGGSRKGTMLMVRNTLIVFMLSGLWHGANWTFMVWGLYHACLLLAERLIGRRHFSDTPSWRQLPRLLLIFVLVSVGWVIFRADSLPAALHYMQQTVQGIMSFSFGGLSYGLQALLWCVVLVVVEWMQRRCAHPLVFSTGISVFRFRVVRWTVYYLLLLVIIFAHGEEQTFIYFQF